jgi:hypothetical protein
VMMLLLVIFMVMCGLKQRQQRRMMGTSWLFTHFRFLKVSSAVWLPNHVDRRYRFFSCYE